MLKTPVFQKSLKSETVYLLSILCKLCVFSPLKKQAVFSVILNLVSFQSEYILSSLILYESRQTTYTVPWWNNWTFIMFQTLYFYPSVFKTYEHQSNCPDESFLKFHSVTFVFVWNLSGKNPQWVANKNSPLYVRRSRSCLRYKFSFFVLQTKLYLSFYSTSNSWHDCLLVTLPNFQILGVHIRRKSIFPLYENCYTN